MRQTSSHAQRAARRSQPEGKQSENRRFRRTHGIVRAACGFSTAVFATFLAGIGISQSTGQSNEGQCESAPGIPILPVMGDRIQASPQVQIGSRKHVLYRIG
jgi:hypothetical protein